MRLVQDDRKTTQRRRSLNAQHMEPAAEEQPEGWMFIEAPVIWDGLNRSSSRHHTKVTISLRNALNYFIKGAYYSSPLQPIYAPSLFLFDLANGVQSILPGEAGHG